MAQGTYALNPWENEIFWQQLVPKYSGGNIVHENGIFQQLLVLKDSGEYRFAFRIICALNAHENIIVRQPLVPKYFREYWFGFGITCTVKSYENGILLCLVGKYIHSTHMKVKYFGSC